jgi:hypothetical protein
MRTAIPRELHEANHLHSHLRDLDREPYKWAKRRCDSFCIYFWGAVGLIDSWITWRLKLHNGRITWIIEKIWKEAVVVCLILWYVPMAWYSLFKRLICFDNPALRHLQYWSTTDCSVKWHKFIHASVRHIIFLLSFNCWFTLPSSIKWLKYQL